MRIVTAVVRGALVLALGCVAGCDGDEADDEGGTSGGALSWRPLVSALSWQLAEAPDDPFAGARPPEMTCDPAGVSVETLTDGPALEIDTGLCDFATVQQAALAEATAGSELRLRVWHDELSAPDAPSVGSIFVVIGGETVLELEVEIPAAPGLVVEEAELPVDVAVGEPIYVHVRNHGFNTWSIAELAALTE